MTVPDLLAARLRTDGPRPLLTWYDDTSGERVELSVATAANWVAKAANLLFDEYGVEAGDPMRLEPADHWLSFVAALATWTAGACVELRDRTPRDAVALPGDPAAFTAAVLPQPDALPVPPLEADSPALAAPHRTWTAAELAAAAVHDARAHGLDNRSRVLTTVGLDSVLGLDASLLLPLASGGSVVFVARCDPSRLVDRAHQERVTHTAGVSVEGLLRLDS